MTDNDTKILCEAYQAIFESKALTPKQIASKAQPAGSTGTKTDKLPNVDAGDTDIEKTLEQSPYTDQHADNFDQDGVDTKIEDRYIAKESTKKALSPKQIKKFAKPAGSKKVIKEGDELNTSEQPTDGNQPDSGKSFEFDTLIDASDIGDLLHTFKAYFLQLPVDEQDKLLNFFRDSYPPMGESVELSRLKTLRAIENAVYGEQYRIIKEKYGEDAAKNSNYGWKVNVDGNQVSITTTLHNKSGAITTYATSGMSKNDFSHEWSR